MRILQAVETICTLVKQSAATHDLQNVTGQSNSEESKPDTDIADDVGRLERRRYEALVVFPSLKPHLLPI